MKKQTHPLYFVSTAYLKHLLFLIVFSLVAVVAAQAQQQDSTRLSSVSKFYVGAELSTTSYSMWNPSKPIGGSFTPIAHVHIGYRWTKRLNVQAGLTFGRDRESGLSGTYYGHADTVIYNYRSWDYYGVALPLTAQFTPFNPNKRLQLYATASIVPIIGKMNQQEWKTSENTTTATYNANDSGIYFISTAGLQLNYRISNRLEAYGKVNLLYRNVGQETYYAKTAKSIGIGLNYRLKRNQ